MSGALRRGIRTPNLLIRSPRPESGRVRARPVVSTFAQVRRGPSRTGPDQPGLELLIWRRSLLTSRDKNGQIWLFDASPTPGVLGYPCGIVRVRVLWAGAASFCAPHSDFTANVPARSRLFPGSASMARRMQTLIAGSRPCAASSARSVRNSGPIVSWPVPRSRGVHTAGDSTGPRRRLSAR